jgi:hypothetical protein
VTVFLDVPASPPLYGWVAVLLCCTPTFASWSPARWLDLLLWPLLARPLSAPRYLGDVTGPALAPPQISIRALVAQRVKDQQR